MYISLHFFVHDFGPGMMYTVQADNNGRTPEWQLVWELKVKKPILNETTPRMVEKRNLKMKNALLHVILLKQHKLASERDFFCWSKMKFLMLIELMKLSLVTPAVILVDQEQTDNPLNEIKGWEFGEAAEVQSDPNWFNLGRIVFSNRKVLSAVKRPQLFWETLDQWGFQC